jgi:hypothetical protein
MKRILPLLVVLTLCSPAVAALPPEGNSKYQLQVVFKCGAHLWLGDQFRDDLRNDLAGILRDALGSMADVRVFDLKKVPAAEMDPFWKSFDSKGFSALDAPRELNGIKTHFVRVDFVNGQYELQSRQQDGLTGFVSPLRFERTVDRALVTRLAAQMIARDFGIVGTAIGSGTDVLGEGDAIVSFRGGTHSAPLDRWVHKGDVFAVYRIMAGDAGKERGTVEANVLVKLTDDPKNGTAPGRVIYRKQANPLKTPAGELGFRCIRLATIVGPMRLRLVDDRGQPHTRTLQVRVHPEKFLTDINPQEEVLEPERGGLYTSKRSYENMCYVRVVTGTQMIARIPVEILDDRPVTVEVGLSLEQEVRGQLMYKRSELRRMYDEAVYVHLNAALSEIAALQKSGKNEAAAKRAKENSLTLDDDIKRLSTQMSEIKEEAENAKVTIDLKDCEDLSKKLLVRQTDLYQKIGALDEQIRAANDPTVLAAKKKFNDSLVRATALIDSNEYDQAIAQYQTIIKEFGEDPNVRKKLEELEALWKVHSPDQAAARKFLYDEWAKAKTVAEIETKLPLMKKHLQVLAREKDRLALIKMQNAQIEVGKILRDEIQAAAQNPDDKDKVEKIKKLGTEFDALSAEIEAAMPKE